VLLFNFLGHDLHDSLDSFIVLILLILSNSFKKWGQTVFKLTSQYGGRYGAGDDGKESITGHD